VRALWTVVLGLREKGSGLLFALIRKQAQSLSFIP
jgi:hypothetical protein